MHITELSRHGVEESLIRLWLKAGHERLLPIQQLAVQRYGLFNGESLLVSAPTSSGKTFIGEMAIANALSMGKKAFYLVPLKALATEKFEAFRERYGPRGARVVVSTRDYREYDRAIEDDAFQIAIVVYEKMQQLLTRKSTLLQRVGLVVADEIQMLSDPERGPDLEVLLTRLRQSKVSFQFVGLSAVLRNNDLLSRWLNARFLEHYERPVELRRGILYEGEFAYETHNSHSRAVEQLPGASEGPAWKVIMSTALGLAAKGEQSLIFLSDKNSTRQMASKAAEEFNGKPAVEAIEELRSLEETRSRQMLIECLQSGIAFHNADLCIEERTVIERHFRLGSIRIICATPTLAVGVNLPVKNVFLEPMLWDDADGKGKPCKRPLTKGEYDNMGGRAGRLSLEENFGRSILVATTPLERTVYQNLYFKAELEELEPRLAGGDLETHAMNLVAAGAADSRQEIARFLRNTFTGLRHAKALSENEGKFEEKIGAAVKRCSEHGILRDVEGRLVPLPLGQLCALKGIAARTGHDIMNWLRSAKGRSLTEIETLYAVARTSEMRAQQMNMSSQEYHGWVYPEKLVALMPREALPFFSPVLDDRIYQTYEDVKAMKVALVLDEWVAGCKALDIEEEYLSLAGTIRSAGEMSGWLVDAAASVAELVGLPDDDVRFLKDLSVRLEVGVAPAGVPFCRIHIRGFGRIHIQKLVNAGFADLTGLRTATDESVATAVGKSMAKKLREWLATGAVNEPPARPNEKSSAPEPASAPVPDVPAAREFACQDRIHFEATVRKRRTVIVVNGTRADIPNKTFAMLMRMAIRLHEDGIGWVRRDEFGESPQQAISNARQDMLPLLLDSKDDILENDGYGSYRLSVPPEHVTFDWVRIREHWDGQIAALARGANASRGAATCGSADG